MFQGQGRRDEGRALGHPDKIFGCENVPVQGQVGMSSDHYEPQFSLVIKILEDQSIKDCFSTVKIFDDQTKFALWQAL
jgi:Zn-dependent membrane protease YugP